MSYEKYTWQTGETITAEKLNHMETGIDDAHKIPKSVAAVKSGNTVTVTATYGDEFGAETTSVSEITLDDNGYPVGVTKDGKDCSLTWEGFE